MSNHQAGCRLRCAFLVVVMAVVLVGCSTAPVAGSGNDERTRIDALFQEAFVEGYRSLDAEKILSIYSPEARVQTRVHGEVGLEQFRAILSADLRLFRALSASVRLEEFALTDAGATVALSLNTQGKLIHGKDVQRADRYYYRLRRAGEDWRVVVQSYRPDFTLPAEQGPHPRKGHPPVGSPGPQQN